MYYIFQTHTHKISSVSLSVVIAFIAMIVAAVNIVVVIKHRLQWNSVHYKQIHPKQNYCTKQNTKCVYMDRFMLKLMINNAWCDHHHHLNHVLIFQFTKCEEQLKVRRRRQRRRRRKIKKPIMEHIKWNAKKNIGSLNSDNFSYTFMGAKWKSKHNHK